VIVVVGLLGLLDDAVTTALRRDVLILGAVEAESSLRAGCEALAASDGRAMHIYRRRLAPCPMSHLRIRIPCHKVFAVWSRLTASLAARSSLPIDRSQLYTMSYISTSYPPSSSPTTPRKDPASSPSTHTSHRYPSDSLSHLHVDLGAARNPPADLDHLSRPIPPPPPSAESPRSAQSFPPRPSSVHRRQSSYLRKLELNAELERKVGPAQNPNSRTALTSLSNSDSPTFASPPVPDPVLIVLILPTKSPSTCPSLLLLAPRPCLTLRRTISLADLSPLLNCPSPELQHPR
jgi:hypothetical protein